MLKTRTIKIKWVTRGKEVQFDPEIKPDAVITYEGKEMVVEKK